MNKLTVLVSIGLVFSATSGFAQQGAGAASIVNKPTLAAQVPVVTGQPATPKATTQAEVVVTNRQSVVDGRSTFLKSSVQSLGWVGKHELVLAKTASLYGANISVLLSANEDGSLTMLAASGVPGIAGTVIAGASEAGAAYLFGASIRPDNYNAVTAGGNGSGAPGNNVTVNNNNNNTAKGGKGGNGGGASAGASASATATGGNGVGVGGNGGNGGNGGRGGGRTHPDSPGNGGIPGNGGQNGNGNNPHTP